MRCATTHLTSGERRLGQMVPDNDMRLQKLPGALTGQKIPQPLGDSPKTQFALRTKEVSYQT